MKHIAITAFLLVVSIINVCAQYQIEGKITDTIGQPIEFVNVYLPDLRIGSSTDSLGKFKVSGLEAGEYKVRISFIGYETMITEIKAPNNKELNYQLVPIKTLDEMVVSATLNPVEKSESSVPVEVYDKSFFKANPTPSLLESMENVNGVRPQNNCNVCNTGDIHINGLEGSYTMILIDGMPIVSGLSTVYGLSGIPQSLIERVEIIKGASSTIYGSEAIGGVINVITKDAKHAPIFTVDVMGSNWGEQNTDLGFSYSNDKFSSLLGVNYFSYNNRIDNNNDGFTDLTIQNRISVFNKLSINRKSKKNLSMTFRYNYEDRWGGEMDWQYQNRGGDEIYGESIFTNRWESTGAYELNTKESLTLQWSANGHFQDSYYGDMHYIGEQVVTFGQLLWRRSFHKHNLTSGLVYRYTFYDDNTTATETPDLAQRNAPSQIHLPGLFIQDEWHLNSQTKLLSGIRYDYNSVHGDIVTPRINLKWSDKKKKNTIRLGVGTGYRVVNIFTEDHAALTGDRVVEFKEELLPETSYNGIVNYTRKLGLRKAMITLDVSGWYTYFTNKIIPDYETNFNKIIYDNLDGYGVSKGASVDVNFVSNYGFSAVLGATVMDISNVEDGILTRQLLTEQLSGVFNLAYTFKKAAVRIDYNGSITGPMLLPTLGVLDSRAETSPWYSLQNIQVTKEFKNGMEIYGGVKNLLNFTPAANSIARAFDPFDRDVTFAANGDVIPTANNPEALTFDASYVYASNQGIRGFFGFRYLLK